MVICLERGANDLHMVQLMALLPITLAFSCVVTCNLLAPLHQVCFETVTIGLNFCKALGSTPPPLFKLQGFQASEPPLFGTCNEAVFCGVQNKK